MRSSSHHQTLFDEEIDRRAVPALKTHILPSPNVLNSPTIAANLFSQPGNAIIVQPPVFFDFFDVIRENARTIFSHPLISRDWHYTMDIDDRVAAISQY